MCGRYAINHLERVHALTELLNIIGQQPKTDTFRPTDNVPTIELTSDGKILWNTRQWAMIPKIPGEPYPKYATFNARVETIAEKRTFKTAFMQQQKCVLPLTDWFESCDIEGSKKKQYSWIRPSDDSLVFAAGLYKTVTFGEHTIQCCTMLTQAPHKRMKHVHDRQPVFIQPSELLDWLTPLSDPETNQEFFDGWLPENLLATFTKKYGMIDSDSPTMTI